MRCDHRVTCQRVANRPRCNPEKSYSGENYKRASRPSLEGEIANANPPRRPSWAAQ
jgi:hypothetical protein